MLHVASSTQLQTFVTRQLLISTTADRDCLGEQSAVTQLQMYSLPVIRLIHSRYRINGSI